MTKPEIDWTINENAGLKEIQRLLGIAEAEVENGRFVLTVASDRKAGESYLFHHFYPTPYSFEDSKMVGKGGVQFCMRKLGEYVNQHQIKEKPYTLEEVAATIGLELPKFDRRAVIAGLDNLEAATSKFIAKAGPDMEPYFREGWHGCVSKANNPYPYQTHGDERHAWNEGWYAADRYLSA
jgi:hypothetical protein